MKYKQRSLISLGVLAILGCIVVSHFCFAERRELLFTAEEKAFIEEHPVIHLGVDPKFIPYEFIDTDGDYKGIAADYLEILSQRTGLKFEIEKNLTWEQAYEKAVQKQLDALPCVSKTTYREQYFLYSAPYYSFKRVVFVNENNNSIKKLSDLKGKKVAVQINSSHHSYLKGFEEIDLSLYKTAEEALCAVSEGTEEIFVGNYATSSYLSKANGITNLKYVSIAEEGKQYLYVAVRKDWPILVNIINKGFGSITEEEKIVIDNRWIGIEQKIDYGEIYKIAAAIGSAVVLIFIVSFYWIMKLRKEVKVRKQIERDLHTAKEEAERANRIKSTFLTRMSHEIRTPLNAITGISYIMKKTDLAPTQKNYMDKIIRASKDMLGIINDILDFSKIEAGKIDIENISFNIDEVIEQIIHIVSFKIDEQKIDFSLHKDSEIPVYFIGDPKRIEQALLNVVSNALKFTQDGAVSMSIRLVARVKDTYTLEFSIKDTGIGMSKEQMEQLFIPFNQADSSISRRFGGTGLGLSIVKSLVEMMEGTMMVYSEPGEGSTFNIQLELQADRNKDYEERIKSASVYFQNIRALVVEKSFFYTNLLKDYLNTFNMVAEFAPSEERAMQLLENASKENAKPYNLLLVDHETVNHGGIEFFTRVKELQNIKEIPKMILMIPLSQEELFDQLEPAGIDLGITKPIIPSILYNGIIEMFKMNVLEIHGSAAVTNETGQFELDYPYRVLVVEDNKTNQFIAKSILEQVGFVVELASDGSEGVALFKGAKEPYHVILMDLHMPVMNGFEAAQHIRAVDTQIPIIAMTADAITGVVEKCSAVGISHYISKPFEPEEFINEICKIVNTERFSYVSEVTTAKGGQEDVALDIEDGIRHMGGNEALYHRVIKEYRIENKDVAGQFEKAIEAKNYDEAVQIVHKIKSSSGSIGARMLHEISTDLQQALTDGNEEAVSVLYKVFKKQLEEVQDAIEKRVDEVGSYTLEK